MGRKAEDPPLHCPYNNLGKLRQGATEAQSKNTRDRAVHRPFLASTRQDHALMAVTGSGLELQALGRA